MNRLMILAAASTLFGVGELAHEFVNPQVDLQPTTPGTAQTGHINVSGNVLAGTVYASAGGNTSKAVSGWATSPVGFVFGGDFRTNSTDGRGIFASATATTGSNFGGDFRSASNAGRGIFGYATATNGQGIGGDFRSDGNIGTGIVGRAMSATGPTTGGLFTSVSSQGIGVQGISSSTSGLTYGGVFENSSTDSPCAAGLFQANGAVGIVAAIRALVTTSTNTHVIGVFADGKAGYGVYAAALDTAGYGMLAQGADVGVNAIGNTGNGSNSTTANKNAYGIKGYAPPAGTGNAVFADGTFAATGTKMLKIDHPSDPENKYLQQYCAEGDSPQLYYRGVAKLDGSGEATVALPSYFDQINRDPSYQLTAIGAPMPNLYVAQKESHNVFKIAGGKSGAEVSWLVIGIRNDRFVQAYGAKAEVDKPNEKRGTYLRPELYNKPQELQESFNPKSLPQKEEQAQPTVSRARRVR